jgi:hypothetical protein
LAACAARRGGSVEVELTQCRFVVFVEGNFFELELPGLGAQRIVRGEERIVIRHA